MLILRDGHFYRSKAALDVARSLATVHAPHATPDGFAVLVLDMRGVVAQPAKDGPPTIERHPPALVLQAEHGHDLMRLADVAGRPEARRVEFALGPISDADREANPTLLDALPDLEPLVEYDHLPEARKDYEVYPRGHKLA